MKFTVLLIFIANISFSQINQKDSDYVLSLQIGAPGFKSYSTGAIELNSLDFDNYSTTKFSYYLGLEMYKRVGYTTSISGGITYNDFLDYESSFFLETSSWQIPLKFQKTFPFTASSYENGFRAINPSGVTIGAGGYYSFNQTISGNNESESNSEVSEFESSKGNFGVIFFAGVSKINGSGMFIEIRQDLTNFADDILVDNDSFLTEPGLKHFYLNLRLNFALFDF